VGYNKLQNLLIGVAIGDAKGVRYEFVTRGLKNRYKTLNLADYELNPNPKFGTGILGMYTDDTQMTIGVCELLLSGKEFNLYNLAQSFLDCYKRDPLPGGYAGGFQKFLNSTETAEDFVTNIKSKSKRNGAAMRATPLGVISDLDTLVEYATINAKLTHNVPMGIASSVCVGLLAHHRIYDRTDNELDFILPYIEKIDPRSAEHYEQAYNLESKDPEILFGKMTKRLGPIKWKKTRKGVPCSGLRTPGAVLYLLNNYGDDPGLTLRESMLLGGDTDTVAAIAVGISAINQGFDSIHNYLIENLTNHDYGKDYLLDLGDQLFKKFY